MQNNREKSIRSCIRGSTLAAVGKEWGEEWRGVVSSVPFPLARSPPFFSALLFVPPPCIHRVAEFIPLKQSLDRYRVQLRKNYMLIEIAWKNPFMIAVRDGGSRLVFRCNEKKTGEIMQIR